MTQPKRCSQCGELAVRKCEKCGALLCDRKQCLALHEEEHEKWEDEQRERQRKEDEQLRSEYLSLAGPLIEKVNRGFCDIEGLTRPSVRICAECERTFCGLCGVEVSSIWPAYVSPLLSQIREMTPKIQAAVERQGWNDLFVLDPVLWYEEGEYESPDESMVSITIIPDNYSHCEKCQATFPERRHRAEEERSRKWAERYGG